MTAKQEIEAIVNDFFRGNADKINAWWNTPNHLLGDIKPAEVIDLGKEERLLKIIKEWRSIALYLPWKEYKAASELRKEACKQLIKENARLRGALEIISKEKDDWGLGCLRPTEAAKIAQAALEGK